MKNKDWGRGRKGLNREGGGGLINSPPLKRGGLLERGGAYLRGGLNRGFTVCEHSPGTPLNFPLNTEVAEWVHCNRHSAQV